MSHSPPPFEPLSAAGLAHLERALPALRTHVVRAARRRRTLRNTAGAAAVIALAAVAWLALRTATTPTNTAPTPTPTSPQPRIADATPTPPTTGLTIALVSTDARIVDRLSNTDPATAIQTIDETALRQALAAANQPTGIIQVRGRTVWEGEWAAKQ
ncbi:hypothetical protein PHYC_03551 [Phycisphaerales bacterium]|nr:hypothetical protein PHYC_03551 [Phycisphaerales bacterium]